MHKVLAEQQERSEALATRLARLESAGAADEPSSTAATTGRAPKTPRKGS
jgi:hypothetical protein